jgi:hypothetical protein
MKVQGALGYYENSINVGGEFESSLSKKAALSGQIYFAPESSNDLINIAGFYKLIVPRSDWKLVFATGVGLYMLTFGTEDIMRFGPQFKFTALKKISSNLSVGLEYLNFYSWFSETNIKGSYSNFILQVSL